MRARKLRIEILKICARVGRSLGKELATPITYFLLLRSTMKYCVFSSKVPSNKTMFNQSWTFTTVSMLQIIISTRAIKEHHLPLRDTFWIFDSHRCRRRQEQARYPTAIFVRPILVLGNPGLFTSSEFWIYLYDSAGWQFIPEKFIRRRYFEIELSVIEHTTIPCQKHMLTYLTLQCLEVTSYRVSDNRPIEVDMKFHYFRNAVNSKT